MIERLFMSRRAAIVSLIEHRRDIVRAITDAPSDKVTQQLHVLDRLILDVRAGRVDVFERDDARRSRVTIAAG